MQQVLQRKNERWGTDAMGHELSERRTPLGVLLLDRTLARGGPLDRSDLDCAQAKARSYQPVRGLVVEPVELARELRNLVCQTLQFERVVSRNDA